MSADIPSPLCCSNMRAKGGVVVVWGRGEGREGSQKNGSWVGAVARSPVLKPTGFRATPMSFDFSPQCSCEPIRADKNQGAFQKSEASLRFGLGYTQHLVRLQ